jgi:hypothetical protein
MNGYKDANGKFHPLDNNSHGLTSSQIDDLGDYALDTHDVDSLRDMKIKIHKQPEQTTKEIYDDFAPVDYDFDNLTAEQRQGLEYRNRPDVRAKQLERNANPVLIAKRKLQAKTPEAIQYRKLSQQKYNQRPDIKEKHRAYRNEYNNQPEVREKKRAYDIVYNKKPEVIQRRADRYKKPFEWY